MISISDGLLGLISPKSRPGQPNSLIPGGWLKPYRTSEAATVVGWLVRNLRYMQGTRRSFSIVLNGARVVPGTMSCQGLLDCRLMIEELDLLVSSG
jgi:hypothetical protein